MSAPTTPAVPHRRGFLAALSAFVAVPAAVATPAIAAAAVQVEPEPAETPELLELGQDLRARLATYRDAAARLVAAREHYERIKPAVPDELIVPAGADRWSNDGISAIETDIEGNEASPPRRLYHWKSLQVEIIVQDRSRHTKEGRRLRRLARLAKTYERAKEDAAKQAGYWDTRDAAYQAAWKVCNLVQPLLQVTPVTMAGLRLYGEAIVAIEQARACVGSAVGHTYPIALGSHLAKALANIEGGADGR